MKQETNLKRLCRNRDFRWITVTGRQVRLKFLH